MIAILLRWLERWAAYQAERRADHVSLEWLREHATDTTGVDLVPWKWPISPR